MNYVDPSGHDPWWMPQDLQDDYWNNSWLVQSNSGGGSWSSNRGGDDEDVGAVCGSNPNNMTAHGPNCVVQTNPSDPIVHLEGLSHPGYSIIPIPYPGGDPPKPQQVDLIKAASPRNLICYSAGVDSCLIYALTTDTPVEKLVLLGGAYYAKLTSTPFETFIDFTSGPEPLGNGFNGAITTLAQNGAHILILDDGNNAGSPNIASGGNVQHVDISAFGNHTQVDDPSSGIWPEVWKWMDNSDYQVPFYQVLP